MDNRLLRSRPSTPPRLFDDRSTTRRRHRECQRRHQVATFLPPTPPPFGSRWALRPSARPDDDPVRREADVARLFETAVSRFDDCVESAQRPSEAIEWSGVR